MNVFLDDIFHIITKYILKGFKKKTPKVGGFVYDGKFSNTRLR